MYKTEKNDNSLEFGLKAREYENVIKLYFKDKPQLKPTFKHFSINDNIDRIKEIIKTNNPVLLGAKPKSESSTFRHRFIAYGISEDGDILINTGWSNEKYKNYKLSQLLKEKDAVLYSAITLSFDSVKIKRSNNYVINGKGYSGSNVNDDVITLGDLNRFLPPTFLWMKTDNYNEKYKLEFYNDEKLILEKEINKFSQITLSYDIWNRNIDDLKMLKVVFQRFDETGKEYEKTYNYFKVKDIKFQKNKIDFKQFYFSKNLSSKRFKIQNGEEEKKISIKNYKVNTKDELVLGIEALKWYSHFNIESKNYIYALSLHINLNKGINFREDTFNLKIKNNKDEKYILHNFLKKEYYKKIINTNKYENYVNILITFPKPINYFSIDLIAVKTGFKYFEIKEMILYEKL